MLIRILVMNLCVIASLCGESLEQYAEQLNMKTAELRMALLQMDIDALKAQLDKEKQANLTAIDHEMRSKKYVLKKLKAELIPLKKNYARKKELYQDGLIPKKEYLQLKQHLAEKRYEIKLHKAALITLWASLRKEKLTPEMRGRHLNYLNELEQFQLLP